jgi:hypothetical protein
MATSSKVKDKYMIIMRNLCLYCVSGASGNIATEQVKVSTDVRKWRRSYAYESHVKHLLCSYLCAVLV